MITNVGKGIAPKVKNLLIASAVVTGGLLTASLCKTPKPAENAIAAEKIEYYMNNETVKEPDAYEWDSRQSVVSNVVDNAKVTGQHIAKAADKATDHPVPLTGALALELMGVGLAGAAIKRNKQNEYQKAALERKALISEYTELKESLYKLNEDYARAWEFRCEKESDVKKAKKEYEFAKIMGPFKGSCGYSPDGDHVYGESSAESEEGFERRLQHLKNNIKEAEKTLKWYDQNYRSAVHRFLVAYDRANELNEKLNLPSGEIINWHEPARLLKQELGLL